MSADWFQFYVRVERKELAVVDEAVERVAVEMIAVRRIGGPVGMGVMRRDDRNAAAAFCDAIEFGTESNYVGNLFGELAAINWVKSISGEGDGNNSET